jgi:hypothetical protein
MIVLCLFVFSLSSIGFSLQYQENSCSIKLSREASKIFHHDIVLKGSKKLIYPSDKCPLLAINSRYSNFERNKHRVKAGMWECKLCSKLFANEVSLDNHFLSSHSENSTITDRSYCLADFCGLLGCPGLLHPTNYTLDELDDHQLEQVDDILSNLDTNESSNVAFNHSTVGSDPARRTSRLRKSSTPRIIRSLNISDSLLSTAQLKEGSRCTKLMRICYPEHSNSTLLASPVEIEKFYSYLDEFFCKKSNLEKSAVQFAKQRHWLSGLDDYFSSPLTIILLCFTGVALSVGIIVLFILLVDKLDDSTGISSEQKGSSSARKSSSLSATSTTGTSSGRRYDSGATSRQRTNKFS